MTLLPKPTSHSIATCNLRARAGQRRRRQSGAATVWVAASLVPLLGFVGLAVDTGRLFSKRNQLQNVADAASTAALHARREGMSKGRATQEARRLVKATLGDCPGDDCWTIDYGGYEFASETFAAGMTNGGPAVQVETRVDNMSLLFLRVLGLSETPISASAVAASKRREIVIVQDITPTWYGLTSGVPSVLFSGIQAAFQDTIAHLYPQDHVGVVVFAGEAEVALPLTPLSSGRQRVIETLGDIELCDQMSMRYRVTGEAEPPLPNFYPRSCEGTNQEEAIEVAMEMFSPAGKDSDFDRIIFIVSDSAACVGNNWGEPFNLDGNPQQLVPQANAIDAATESYKKGIDVISVMIKPRRAATQDECTPVAGRPQANIAFNEVFHQSDLTEALSTACSNEGCTAEQLEALRDGVKFSRLTKVYLVK